MLMLRIAICDDDENCLGEIKHMLERWAAATSSEIRIDSFDNGDDLIVKCENFSYDLIFLDIIMPLLNGMETAKEVRELNKAVKIVFLTSSPEFALESYSVKATDYIVKPITYQRLNEVMEYAIADCRQAPQSMTLKTVGGYQRIYIHDIEYIEAQNKRVFLYLKSGRIVQVIQPLYTFEKELSDSLGFFKCHRSYLVYLPNVDYFNNTEIKTKSGRSIPIARGYAKPFKDAYFALMFQE